MDRHAFVDIYEKPFFCALIFSYYCAFDHSKAIVSNKYLYPIIYKLNSHLLFTLQNFFLHAQRERISQYERRNQQRIIRLQTRVRQSDG